MTKLLRSITTVEHVSNQTSRCHTMVVSELRSVFMLMAVHWRQQCRERYGRPTPAPAETTATC